MRVVVFGARGKVGQALLSEIAASPELELGEAIGGRVELEGASFAGDVVVDFSAPAGTLALLERLAGGTLPLVIGTTGFSEGESAIIAQAAEHRPILMAANFTLGFEEFRALAKALAAALPRATLTVAEVYKADKKPVASGTTQLLVADLTTPERTPGIEIGREGDIAGINRIALDLGPSRIELQLTVASRAAYAAGALAAARWLIAQPPGLYRLSDMM